VFRIRLSLNADPDPVFYLNADPDLDPRSFFLGPRMKQIESLKKIDFLHLFQFFLTNDMKELIQNFNLSMSYDTK